VQAEKAVFQNRTAHSQTVVRKLKKEPPHVQAHLVFRNPKTNAKKPKELSLPHHHPEIKIITT